MIVEQNEFTMAETVSPLALAFCVFIEEGCRIDPKLFLRAPRNTIEDLPYYSQP
jgi:hypothetical protein